MSLSFLRKTCYHESMICTTYSEEETFALAARMAEHARPGQIYALDGDLGAGKTVFCRGFAEGLGVTELVNSPTFTIIQEYTTGRLPLTHFDVYRIEEIEELDEIGADEYFYGKGICLIEWAERIRALLPEDTVWIRLERVPEESMDARRITITGDKEDTAAERDREDKDDTVAVGDKEDKDATVAESDREGEGS